MVEMTETANILNNATDPQPGHPRRDRPGDQHVRRRLARLGDHRAHPRPRRRPDPLRDPLPRAGRPRKDEAKAPQRQRRRPRGRAARSSSCTGSSPAAPTRATGSTSPGSPACPRPVLARAREILAFLEKQHVPEAESSRAPLPEGQDRPGLAEQPLRRAARPAPGRAPRASTPPRLTPEGAIALIRSAQRTRHELKQAVYWFDAGLSMDPRVAAIGWSSATSLTVRRSSDQGMAFVLVGLDPDDHAGRLQPELADARSWAYKVAFSAYGKLCRPGPTFS